MTITERAGYNKIPIEILENYWNESHNIVGLYNSSEKEAVLCAYLDGLVARAKGSYISHSRHEYPTVFIDGLRTEWEPKRDNVWFTYPDVKPTKNDVYLICYKKDEYSVSYTDCCWLSDQWDTDDSKVLGWTSVNWFER